MWIEELDNGKYKYFERYKDPLTEKWRKVSVTMEKSNRQADKKAHALLQQKIDTKLSKQKETELTYAELFKRFYKNWSPSVKLSTITSVKHLDNTISRYIGSDVLIKNITSNVIQNLVDELFDKGMTYTTIRKVKSRLNSILKFGLKHGYIDTLETSLVEVKRPPETLVQQEKRLNKFLEVDDVKRLIEAIDAYPSFKIKYTNLIKVLYLTGMRYSEAAALTVDDVDFEAKTIHVIGNYDHKNHIKTTAKTAASRRSIQVSADIIEAIKDQLTFNAKHYPIYNQDFNPDGYIFIKHTGRPISTANMLLALHTCAKKAGISKNITTHIFRHSHISYLAEQGVPVNVIMQRVGHADSKMTLEIYSHVTQRMEKELMQKIERISL